MGEEGEDTSWKSFTERFQRGSGQSSRSPMAAHGEERGEVEKKERKKKEEESLHPNWYKEQGAWRLVGAL
jgi:hypothetical protein